MNFVTRSLEVSHSYDQVCTKASGVCSGPMTGCTALAALDHNMSVKRQQATNKDGEKMYRKNTQHTFYGELNKIVLNLRRGQRFGECPFCNDFRL